MNILENALKKKQSLEAHIRSGRLLAPTPALSQQFPLLETRLEIALAVAQWKDGEPLPQNWPSLTDWSDKCENEIAKINGSLYRLADYSSVIVKIRSFSDELEQLLMTTLTPSAPELIDYISYHMDALIRVSTVSVEPWPFFDRIEAAYLAGGWPCGWIANDSGGDILVYSGNEVKR